MVKSVNNLKRVMALALSIILITISANLVVYADAGLTGWKIQLKNVDGTVETDKDESYSGNASMKVVNNTPIASEKYILISTDINVVAGKTYHFGAKVKSKNTTSLNMMLDWGARSSLLPIGSTFDWSNLEFVYIAPKTMKSSFQILIEGTTDGLWLDDIVFIDWETKENLIGNSSFDGGATVVSENNLEEVYQSIVTSEMFSEEDFSKARGGFKYMPVYGAKDITIDGNIDDWSPYMPLKMPTLSNQYQIYMNDSQALDVQAECKFAFDDENFYMMIDVIDDNYVYVSGDGYWQGDSIQFVIGGIDEGYGSEIGLNYNPETKKGEVHGTAFDGATMREIIVAATQTENKTTYEVSFPWKIKFKELPEKILFNVLANDNDGSGRRYCAELAPGISEGKTSALFPVLELLKNEKDWYCWMEGDKSGYTDTEYTFNAFIVNIGEEKNFIIETDNEKKEISVPSGMGIRYEIKRIFNEVGEYTLKTDISTDKEKITSAASIKIEKKPASIDYARNVSAQVKEYVKELKELIEKCEENGIPTDYETVNFKVIERFSAYIDDEISKNDFSRIYYLEAAINELYKESVEALSDYLDGKRQPKVVHKVITSDMTIDGTSVFAMTNDGSGEKERPVFYVGYGHFDNAMNDIPNFQELGANTIQEELGVTSVIDFATDARSGELILSPRVDRVTRIINILEEAEKNDIAVSVLLSPHYFPGAIISKHDIGYTGRGFLKYNVNAPIARKIVEEYLRLIIPLIKDYKSLNNICISNEPEFEVDGCGDYYLADWHEYIRERYVTIEALNKSYEESYESFEEVPFRSEKNNIAHVYDFANFNDKVFADWHQWMADIIHEIAPDIPLHSKIMGYTREPGPLGRSNNGTGYEHVMNAYELNGCDFWNYIDDANGPLVKEIWYDYMISLKNVPVINSEDHIIPDRSTNYGLEVADYVAQDIYQGAIHGRAISNIWVWERSNDPKSDFAGSILFRPDAIAKIGKASLDLNRLSYEITALQNEKPEVAILYSDANVLGKLDSINALYAAYEACVFSGQKVRFITETQLYKMNDYKFLILPNVCYATDDTLLYVKEFIENGGRVLIMGDNSLEKNERNLNTDTELRKFIFDNSDFIAYESDENNKTITPTKEELTDKVRAILNEERLDYVKLIDTTTNEFADDVEYNVGVYNDRLIVNMVSFSAEDKKVKIYVGDTLLENGIERRSETEAGDEILLKQYIPVTMEYSVENPMLDTYGHWSEEDIAELYGSGIVKGVSSSRYAPEEKVTVAQFIALLVRAVGINTGIYNGGIPDVQSDKWYSSDIAAAMNAGIIPSGEMLYPDEYITRENMCKFIVKAYEYKNGEINREPVNFEDKDSISEMVYVEKAVSAGLMLGNDDGTFAPTDTATRAEAASVIKRIIK